MKIDKVFQNTCIKILNPIYSVTRHINKQTRDGVVFFLLFFIIFFINATRSTALREAYVFPIFETTFSQYMFCTVLFIILSLFSIEGRLEEKEWRKGVFYTDFFLGLAIIIVSFIHPVGEGYRLFGFQISFIFPLFYLIWNNRKDYGNLFRAISHALVYTGILFFVITFFYAVNGGLKMDGARCCGIMANANCFSLIGLQMYLGAVYISATEKLGISKLIIFSVSAGIGIGIMVIGQMRLSILAAITCSIFTIYFKTRYFREKVDRQRLAFWVLTTVIVLISINATNALVDINNNALRTNGSQEVVVEDSGVLDRFAINEEGNADQYASGRIWIWKNYAKHLNFLGNNYDYFNSEEMTGSHVGYAHNVFLEMGYRFGVPIAIWYLLYMLICGIVCLFYLFKRSKTKKPYLLFPIIAAIVFVVESLLDCALLPFLQVEAFMYYISIVTVIDRRGAV